MDAGTGECNGSHPRSSPTGVYFVRFRTWFAPRVRGAVIPRSEPSRNPRAIDRGESPYGSVSPAFTQLELIARAFARAFP